jgi:hypothetical protein
VFIDVGVEGFFLVVSTSSPRWLDVSQHETMDEAMWQAYSEYEFAGWRSCREDVDPVAYIRARFDRDPHMTARGG